MVPSFQFVQDTFKQFNELCFGGALPPIRIKFTRAASFVAKVTYRKKMSLLGINRGNEDFVLRISLLFDLDPKEWEDVIIHEMIHYYIGLNGIPDSSSHGVKFRSMMNEINLKFGRHLTVSHKSKPGEKLVPMSKKRAEYIVCLSRFAKGGYGVTVCASTRVRYIRRVLDSSPQIAQTQWFVSNNPLFAKYPKSRTARVYHITQEDLDVVLE